jgi:2,5-diketo-D-gluconate reductase A
VFDFELTDVELAAIDSLDLGIRRGPEPDEVRPPSRSFVIPES